LMAQAADAEASLFINRQAKSEVIVV